MPEELGPDRAVPSDGAGQVPVFGGPAVGFIERPFPQEPVPQEPVVTRQVPAGAGLTQKPHQCIRLNRTNAYDWL